MLLARAMAVAAAASGRARPFVFPRSLIKCLDDELRFID
jgi:hypothetical protein